MRKQAGIGAALSQKWEKVNLLQWIILQRYVQLYSILFLMLQMFLKTIHAAILNQQNIIFPTPR